MNSGSPRRIVFYRSESGNEPVREWLRRLPKLDRKCIGEDIKTVQFGWPLGMPLIRKVERELLEVRSTLKNRIARVIFTMSNDQIVLLHGFIKKTQKIPKRDLNLARQRMKQLEEGYEE